MLSKNPNIKINQRIIQNKNIRKVRKDNYE